MKGARKERMHQQVGQDGEEEEGDVRRLPPAGVDNLCARDTLAPRKALGTIDIPSTPRKSPQTPLTHGTT